MQGTSIQHSGALETSFSSLSISSSSSVPSSVSSPSSSSLSVVVPADAIPRAQSRSPQLQNSIFEEIDREREKAEREKTAQLGSSADANVGIVQ
jgi:hypothetical protein